VDGLVADDGVWVKGTVVKNADNGDLKVKCIDWEAKTKRQQTLNVARADVLLRWS